MLYCSMPLRLVSAKQNKVKSAEFWFFDDRRSMDGTVQADLSAVPGGTAPMTSVSYAQVQN